MLSEFLSGVVILGIDEEICRRLGQLHGSLRSAGKLVGDFDLLVAASALRHDLTLLTNNRKHFERIESLRVESTVAQTGLARSCFAG
jgi:predicted nucleic acid-binding protein